MNNKNVTILLDEADFEKEMMEIYPKESLTPEQLAHAMSLTKVEAIKYIKENASCVDGLKSAAIYYDLYINKN